MKTCDEHVLGRRKRDSPGYPSLDISLVYHLTGIFDINIPTNINKNFSHILIFTIIVVAHGVGPGGAEDPGLDDMPGGRDEKGDMVTLSTLQLSHFFLVSFSIGRIRQLLNIVTKHGTKFGAFEGLAESFNLMLGGFRGRGAVVGLRKMGVKDGRHFVWSFSVVVPKLVESFLMRFLSFASARLAG